MNIERKMNLASELKHKSYFLLGPRQTGKTWLISHTLANYPTYNLLNNKTYLKLSRAPQILREECSSKDKIVVIDEIQKLPNLLDEVHFLIEEKGLHFLLTGSSARKLRRGGVNLLGGRARVKHLHPLSQCELKEHFDLTKALHYGLLPSIYFSNSPEEDLEAYVGIYLKEEIAAEGLTRNIPAFSRFLEVAALCHGQLINYTNMGNDAQVARTTVQEYFQILKDTLIAHEVPAWGKSKKRKPLSTSKFYFFDVGVARFLQNRAPSRRGSPEFGEAFEAYIFHELKTFSDYNRTGEVKYWRSLSGYEVDFILADQTAIEVKATRTVSPQDLNGLKALSQEKALKHYILVSLEERARKVDNIHLLPWKDFLEGLWQGAWS